MDTMNTTGQQTKDWIDRMNAQGLVMRTMNVTTNGGGGGSHASITCAPDALLTRPLPAVGEDAPLAGKGDHAFTLHHSICRHCGISLLRALLNDVWSCVPVTVPDLPDEATAVRDDSALLRAVRL